MDGDLGATGGTVPPKFEVGTAHVSVPPIFGEVVLLEACQSTCTNRLKNGVMEEFFMNKTIFRQEKGYM